MKSENYQNFQIFSFSQLASTNDTAFEMIKNGQASHNSVVICDSQTGGRGRLGRKWQQGNGNLYLSLILRPEIDVKDAPQLVFVAINALHDAVKQLHTEQGLNNDDIKISKKWPNDLLINDKKVAGILLENTIIDSKVDAIVVGLGVNVTTSPENVMFKAANLQDLEFKVDKEQVWQKFLANFAVNYQSWQDFGFKVVKNKFINDAWRLSEEISINNNKVNISGIFEGINQDGAIVINTSQGVRQVAFGDVS